MGLYTQWESPEMVRERDAWLGRRLSAVAGCTVEVGEVEMVFSLRKGLQMVLGNMRMLRTRDTIAVAGSDPNAQYFDLRIRSAILSLSLGRWVAGKGVVSAASVDGIRGILDRRHLAWLTPPHREADDDNGLPTPYLSGPESAPHLLGKPYLQEFEEFQVTDCVVGVFQAGRLPLDLSVHHALLRPYRYQWQHLDLSTAVAFVGSFDPHNSNGPAVFSTSRLVWGSSPSPTPNKGNDDDGDGDDGDGVVGEIVGVPDSGMEDGSRMALMVLSNMGIRRLTESTHGPLSWLDAGQVDITMALTLPPEPGPEGMEQRRVGYSAGNRSLMSQERLPAPRAVHYQVHIVMRNIHAGNPRIDLWAPGSALYSQLARPIVAYMNAHHTRIDLVFEFTLDEASFDGAMGPWNAGVWDALSFGAYNALVDRLPTSTPALYALMAREWAVWAANILRGSWDLIWIQDVPSQLTRTQPHHHDHSLSSPLCIQFELL